MTVEPASTRANRINSDSLDWSYIAISLNGCAFDLKHSRQFRVPAVRAGQRPVLTGNDPLNIFGNQRQQILLIVPAHGCEEILHNLNILFDAHRISPFSLRRIVSDLVEANSDGREAAVDRQLHPIHEARIV